MRPLLAALVLLPSLAFAQAAAPLRVSVDARGEDVREVLATLFAQAHKPYALDASIRGQLYVTLDAMPFEKALDVVLLQAGLVAKLKNGVTMIAPAPKAAAPTTLPLPKKTLPTPAPMTATLPTLPKAAFARRVTTRLTRTPLADVFAALGEQTKVTIQLDPSVPAYRVDAFFVKTSLGYALDRICKAAGLEYRVEGQTIKVAKASSVEPKA